MGARANNNIQYYMKLSLSLLFAIYLLFLICRVEGFDAKAYNQNEYSENLLTNDFHILLKEGGMKKSTSYESDLEVLDKDHKGDTRVSLSLPMRKTHDFKIAT